MFSFLIGLDKLKQRRVIDPTNTISNQPQIQTQIQSQKIQQRSLGYSQPRTQNSYAMRRTAWSMNVGTSSGRCACGS